ncbi:MAG: B12-binding domain-containing radical SAM protein [Candidatus Adiutrix sp.]|jgi:radical SAM superfamily enzyme YgiQ (UPF0313 family)|nr:B12-binding domain-containing radical SAM protein [Candidatus Adiutrix sp.]
MNCLLIVPPSTVAGSPVFFPMGISLISAALKTAGDVKVVNLNLCLVDDDDQEKVILSIIKDEKIDAVFSGGLIYDYKNIRRIFEIVKNYNPGLITVTGGAVITGDPLVSMDLIGLADYGILGEGERTAVELCRALKAGDSVEKVAGLMIRRDGGYIFTQEREVIKDWSEIPLADYQGFGADDYFRDLKLGRVQAPEGAQPPKIYLISSRGCPFLCTFCHNSQGKIYRARPLDDLFQEIDFRLRTYETGDLKIVDDLLANSKSRLKEFCRRIKSYDFRGWTISLRVPQIDAETAAHLKEAGCGYAILGLESASDKILASMGKHLTLKQTEAALKCLYDVKLRFVGTLIFGDAEETYADARETLDWWAGHPEYYIYLRRTLLYPGSLLYRRAVADGRINPYELIEKMIPPVNVSKMTDEEYARLGREIEAAEFHRVNSLQTHMHPRQAVIECNYGTMRKSLRGQCPYCGAELKDEMYLYRMSAVCPQCRCEMFLPFAGPAAPELIRENLRKILAKYGKFAFWGIGLLFKRFVPEQILEGLNGVYLIDRSERGVYAGQALLPPEAVRDENIKYIVTVPEKSSKSYSSIYRQARSYQVDHITDLYQIQADSFDV